MDVAVAAAAAADGGVDCGSFLTSLLYNMSFRLRLSFQHLMMEEWAFCLEETEIVFLIPEKGEALHVFTVTALTQYLEVTTSPVNQATKTLENINRDEKTTHSQNVYIFTFPVINFH